MSLFVKLPVRFYEGDAFDGFSPEADFRLGTARAMAWLSQLAYETDEPDKIAQLLGGWGLRLIDGVIAAEASTVLPIASTHGFVAAGRGATFVAFAGTDPVVLANWITDFDAHLTRMGTASGYAEAAAIVRDAVAARVEKRSAAENRLFFAGHSLGGALAAVVAHGTAAADAPAAVYTFGMPRPGNGDFKRAYDAAIGTATYRLVHGADLVPTVAPSELGFRHVGRYLCCQRLGKFAAADLAADTASDAPLFAKGEAAELNDFLHAPLAAAQDALAQLRLAAEMAAGIAPPGARTDLGGIVIELLPPRLRDHMPDRYCAALRP